MLSDRQLEERKLRQDRILSSALDVFKANGLEGATMDSIAEKAGFGKATLYYYFSSKEEVFLGIMEEGWKSLLASLEVIIQEEQSPRKTFIKILVQIAQNAKHKPNLYEFLFQAPKAINLTEFDDQKWKKHQGKLYSILQSLLEDGIERKEFPKLNSNLMFKAIGGLFTGLIFFGDKKKTSISEEEVEALLNNLISKQ
tara:strand:- start:526 stop:1119 length:594 start_codon:yes stop_codon:yes gene_type:complete